MFQLSAASRRSVSALLVDWQWERTIRQLVDYSLCSIIVLAPFVWGGRSDVGRLIYAILASAAVCGWTALQWKGRNARWRWSRSFVVPILATVWTAIQLVPLPPVVVQWLSPRITHLMPLLHSDVSSSLLGMQGWRTLSVNPAAGQISLAVLLTYGLIFFLAVQWIRTIDHVGRILRWLALASVAMAVFGLLQYFTADGLFFWVYEHPFRKSNHYVCGSFINRNHFASFLAMGAVAIAYQLVRIEPAPTNNSRQIRHQPADHVAMGWAAALAVVLVALVLSASRGGALAAVAGTSVMVVAYWRRKLWGAKQVAYVVLAGALLCAGVTVYSEDRLLRRFEDFTAGSLDAMDRLGGRRAIWAANVAAFNDGWVAGSGAGTHENIYPVYISKSYPKVFTHAENGYLQIATEMGLPGVFLLLAAVGCVTRWGLLAWRRCTDRDSAACLGAIVAGLTISLVHSAVDFVWYIPATMTIVLFLIAALRCLAHDGQLATSARAALSQGRPAVELSIGVACVVAYMLAVLTGPAMASTAWSRYLSCSAQHGVDQHQSYTELTATGDPAVLQRESSQLRNKISALDATLRYNPQSAAAHLRLAQAYLQWFDARSSVRDNRMTLGQIQNTVASGGFESASDVKKWLERAVGNDIKILDAAARHATRCIQLSPMEGMAYVCLANLQFMSRTDSSSTAQLLSQAAIVRPLAGDILFEIGKQHLLNGELQPAIDHWVKCYAQEGEHRLLVVATLAGRLPAEQFVATFEPDWQTLRPIWQRYKAADTPAELAILLEYARRVADNYQPAAGKTPAAYVWLWLGEMYGDVGDQEQQLACLERAVSENERIFAVRNAYATALYHAGRYAEVEPHLRWLLARRPENSGLRKLLHSAAVMRHKQASAAGEGTRRSRYTQ